MSTFNGTVKEFPDIRIDYFRTLPGIRPPAACFLSHVHSDHLQGLESLKMPFVYCSAVTKQLLLKLEKYPHRINFAKGILETRKQHYRHLRFILRELPLEAPTEIELDLEKKIRVTLFDANHCPGAVMFLMQDRNKAILYTGDIRAEQWWVNSLVQNPVLLPYSCGLKTLDCIYLDTTFASHENMYEVFPNKAQGIAELLKKIDQYDSQTIFYFRSWTLGYEKVWIALANHMHCQIHVDDYQLGLYASLASSMRGMIFSLSDGPILTGYTVGNGEQRGILTRDSNVRLHSCEPGSECHASLLKHRRVVWIIPIISRLSDGTEVRELGAGGGGNDLYQVPVLEFTDSTLLDSLTKSNKLICQTSEDKHVLEDVIKRGLASRLQTVSIADLDLDDQSEIAITDFIHAVRQRGQPKENFTPFTDHSAMQQQSQLSVIRFPYSRHSSYNEQRALISAFKPRDIHPCTVDVETWTEEVSMESLFGDLCSARTFYHDDWMRQLVGMQPSPLTEGKTPSLRSQKRKHALVDHSPQRASEDKEYCSANTRPTPRERPSQPLSAVHLPKTNGDSNANIASKRIMTVEHPGATTTIEVQPSLEALTTSPRICDPAQYGQSHFRSPSIHSQEVHPESFMDTGSPFHISMEAFYAAAECLETGMNTRWGDLGLRCIDQKTHTEQEIDL